jgi:arylsulfatase A-like enzyme
MKKYTPVTSRRDFLKTIGLGLLSISFLSKKTSIASSTPKPNVLFISIDDLNDWIGCLGGHPDTKTPNLDLLAKRGILFTNAFCSAPSCNPSRVSLLTGIRPSTSGVYFNKQPWRDSHVLYDKVTLPQHFRENGYTVMGSGKIFHGAYPDPPSWDEYWPSKETTYPADPKPENRPLNGFPDISNFDWGPMDVANEDMGDWQVTDWVIEQLNQVHDKPFFLGCGIYKPHLSWYVPPEYFDRFPLESITLPEVNPDDQNDIPEAGIKMANKLHEKVLLYNQWKQAVQGYLACISFADDCIGRVIDALDSSEYKDNTIIVLWSDHGWHLGEKLHWKKFALWEEATHNVLMFVAPGVLPEDQKCHEPVSLLDIYPTLIDLCDLTPREGLEGSSLLPLLQNPAMEWDRPILTTHGYKNHTLRTKRWRYIQYADGSEELYDHNSDPLEWTNLAANETYTEIKANLSQSLPEINVEYTPLSIEYNIDERPIEYFLFQNYPNPFNPVTLIKYQIPSKSFVTVEIFDHLGQKIRTLVNEQKLAGTHSIEFDGSDGKGNQLASGIYFYNIRTNSTVLSKKMILVK